MTQGQITITSPVSGPEAPKTETTTQTTERPKWLPEKFKSAEDLATAYTELEKKLGGQPQQQTTPPTTEKKPETTQTQQQQQPPSNVDLTKYESEFSTNGSLSEASYKELADKGFSKQVVDNYIEGQKATAERSQREVFESVGGQDQYTQMTQWAAKGLTPAEINAYNTAMNSGDLNAIKLAATGLKAKFTAAYGRDPKLIGGGKTDSGPAPFANSAQVVAAMNDPRYREDPAFREEVAARLARTNF